MSVAELNPAMGAIKEAMRLSGVALVVKEQPNDGLLLELGDGSVWGVNAHLVRP